MNDPICHHCNNPLHPESSSVVYQRKQEGWDNDRQYHPFCLIDRLEGEIRQLEANQRVLTCVYCGHPYPEGTPPHSSDVLTAHIKVCDLHPMRQLERDIEAYRQFYREICQEYLLPCGIADCGNRACLALGTLQKAVS